MKRQRLQDALDKLPAVPGEALLELIMASSYALRQGDGMSWDEIITMVEKKSGDDLSSHRPKKCPKCGSSLYRSGNCDSYTCENSQWLRRSHDRPNKNLESPVEQGRAD